MKAADHPRNGDRLAALRAYAILDMPTAAQFDEIVSLASTLCGTPIAMINLIDADRQWFLSEIGLGARSTPLESSICAHAILQDDFFEVPDLTADPRFTDNPTVTGAPHLRSYAGALLRSHDGYPIGTLCTLDLQPRAVTDQQRRVLEILARRVMTEFELRRRSREAEALATQLAGALEDRQRILDIVSHDLRSPLSTIALSGQLLSRGTLDGDLQVSIALRINRAVQRMKHLVDDLIDAGSLREGRLSVHRAKTDARALLEQAVDSAQLLAAATEVALSLHVDPNLGTTEWDGQRVAQVLENVIGNALKFTPAGGRITVEAHRDGDRVRFQVIDTGVGIPPDAIGQVFEPFVQAGLGDRRGVGLGLALARNIVQAHGGEIGIESAVGQGTRIWFELPVSA